MFMTFDDAADTLAGAFSFHVEARKNRFGIFSDLNFVRLSTESAFTLQEPLAVTVNGDADVDNTFFEAGASYLLPYWRLCFSSRRYWSSPLYSSKSRRRRVSNTAPW